MKPIYVQMNGTAVVEVYEDLTDINDSLLLESGTVIARYDNKETDTHITYEVCGEVKISYKDDWYRYPQDFPEELTEMIRNGTLYDSEDVYVDCNNWFEIFYVGNEEWTSIIDIENMTPEQIAEDIIEVAKENV